MAGLSGFGGNAGYGAAQATDPYAQAVARLTGSLGLSKPPTAPGAGLSYGIANPLAGTAAPLPRPTPGPGISTAPAPSAGMNQAAAALAPPRATPMSAPASGPASVAAAPAPSPAPATSGVIPMSAGTGAAAQPPSGGYAPTGQKVAPPGVPNNVAAKVGATSSKDASYWSSVWDGIRGTPGEKQLNDYINYLYSLPAYKGSNEANRAMIAQYARELRTQQGNATQNNYEGLSKLGDESSALRDQLSASLAARGIEGPAVGGALANLGGRTASAASDYISNQDAVTRQQNLQLQLAQMESDRQMAMFAAQQAINQANQPGFGQELLGVLGQGVGYALPGIGKAVGRLVGGGNGQAPTPSPFY